MQNREKITPSRSSAVNSPVIADSACARRAVPRRRARAAAGGCRDELRAPRRVRAAASRSACEMTLAREKGALHVLVRAGHARASLLPASSMPARRSSPTATRAAARVARFSRGARHRRKSGEVDLVVHDDARQRRGSRARMRRPPRPACVAASRASTSTSARSARCTAAQVRSMPSARSGRRSARRPAVSMIVSGMPRDLDARCDGVARRARDRRDDRHVLAGQLVEQARLADVRPPDQHDGEPVAQQRALRARARSNARELARGSPRAAPRASAARRNSMSSSGKSSVASVNIRSSISASTSARDLAREGAGQAARGGARRGRGRGLDQVGHALGLREIELAVEERALREFARLARAARRARRSARAAGAAPPGRRGRAARARPRRCTNAAPGSTARGPGRASRRRRRETSRAWRARGVERAPTMPRDQRRQRRGPETRTTPMPPRPGGVAMAAMVSAAARPRAALIA